MHVIALTGLATAGKDAFCSGLVKVLGEQGVQAQRFALADELKRKIHMPLWHLAGIDVFNCTKQEKSIIRDYLVAVGKIKRIQSKGTYWTGLLEEQIKNSSVDVAIITDVRYDFYPEDEIFWAKKKMGGILVHISRYEVLDDMDDIIGTNAVMVDGEARLYVQPPNEDEKKNDPKLREQAEWKITWPTCKDKNPEAIEAHCRPYVESFVQLLKNVGQL